MSSINYAARARAHAKDRRARALELTRKKIDNFREVYPLPQGQLELNDAPYSRREWLQKIQGEVFNDASH